MVAYAPGVARPTTPTLNMEAALQAEDMDISDSKELDEGWIGNSFGVTAQRTFQIVLRLKRCHKYNVDQVKAFSTIPQSDEVYYM